MNPELQEHIRQLEDQPVPVELRAAKIEAYARDIDLSLIEANLRMTPQERLKAASDAANSIDALREAYWKSRK